MKNILQTFTKPAGLATGVLTLLFSNVQAATYPLTVTNAALGSNPVTFTLTEADGFNSGGSVGNTAQAASPATFFTGSAGAGAGLWDWRDFGSLNLSGGGNPGGVDLLETTPSYGSPELRTVISGLPLNTYEVYLVYLTRTDGGGDPQLLADIETGGVTSATTIRRRDASTVLSGRVAAGVWAVSLQPLGQITGTSFNLLVGSSPTAADRGDYIGIAYVPAGAARVYNPPSPASQTVFGGANVTYTASAFGNPVPAYQWLKNGTNILGATSNTLNLNNVSTSDAGLYSVRVTNTTGTNVSASAQLNVITPLSATTSDIALGTNAPFRFIQADAFVFGGTAGNTVSATDPATDFAVEGVTVTGYWNFRDFANLDFFGVNPANPDCFETSPGNNAPTLRTTLSGLAPAIYEVSLVQLSHNGGVPTGLFADIDSSGTGTNATTFRQRDGFTLRTGVTAQNGTWEVDLQPLGQVSGNTINVLVGDAPGVNRGDYFGLAYRLASSSAASFISQPASQVRFAGSSVTFSSSAVGNPFPTYQWRKNGTNILNATNATYTIASPQTADAGNYSVAVTNNLGGAVSSIAALNIFAPTGPTTVDISVSTNGTFHFIAVDSFSSGGSPGNTVAITNPAAFFSSTSGETGLWNYRDFANLDLYGVGNPTAPDLLETAPSTFPPELRTTISGLPSNNYDVFLVQTRRTDGVAVGLLADLQTGGVTTPTTIRTNGASSIGTAKQASVFEVVLTPLGRVSGTSFSVLVGSAQNVDRGDYIGVAYHAVDLITLTRNGGLTQITWTGVGTLQVASVVTGPYVDIVPTATSPYTVDTSVGQKFYRLKR